MSDGSTNWLSARVERSRPRDGAHPRVARDVAHRVERKDTPLAAFLLGMHVARRTRAAPLERCPRRCDRDLAKPSFRRPNGRSAETRVPGRLVG